MGGRRYWLRIMADGGPSC